MNTMINASLIADAIKSNKVKDGRGRPATFTSKKSIAQHLAQPEKLSRFLKLQLVNQGLLEIVPVHKATRGRPAFDYKLTGKGRGLVAISRNWGKKKTTQDVEADRFHVEADKFHVEAEAEVVTKADLDAAQEAFDVAVEVNEIEAEAFQAP